MDLSQLKVNRFLYKSNPDPVEDGVIYMSENVNSKKNLESKNNPNNDLKDARQIITGTVITDCIIQTSGLPHRVLINDNDITFFDDTDVVNDHFIGNTSRLVFQSAKQVDQTDPRGAFIMEKRVSINDPLDSVLSWYATPPIDGHHNWLFIGRNGSDLDPERNLNAMYFAVNIVSDDDASAGNGVWAVEVDTDGVVPDIFALVIGDTRTIASPLTGGWSAFLTASDGGVVGLGYQSGVNTALLWYLLNSTTISMGADVIPDADGVYDIGSPSAKIATLYGSVVACPLPTVEDALSILKRIPDATTVGDRGHYGDGLYFDDLTFPEELLWTDKKGRTDIEHNHVLGFLVQVVKELNAKVDNLEALLAAK